MKICGIYKITNPNNHIYIGQSINIKRRFGEYKRLSGFKTDTRLLNSLKKHGFENHKFEILEQCERGLLNIRELYYINFHQSYNTEIGMNLQKGGDCHEVSDESREKLKTSHLGQKAWNKGIPRTDEQKMAHSIKMKGHTASEETKLKMGASRKGKIHTDETKKKLSDAKKGNQIWAGRKHTEESKLKMRKPKPKKDGTNIIP